VDVLVAAALALAILTVPTVAVVLSVYGLSALFGEGWARLAAAVGMLALVGACGTYGSGLLLSAGDMLDPCGTRDRDVSVVGDEDVSFVGYENEGWPLRRECVWSDGHREEMVPGFVNPWVAALSVTGVAGLAMAVGATGLSGLRTELQRGRR
jgi:hypothetical protein